MALNTKTFDQIVTETVTAIQASAAQLVDFTIGSILRAMAESNASLVLWIQGLILNLLVTVRAATCTGSDLDSWCADFSFYRLPAVASSGNVTFARFTTTQAAFIPVGTQIETSDLSPEIFAVTADAGNANYSAVRNGYTIDAGIGSISVPVQCTVAGAAGNVLANQCNILKGSIAGVDTVTNPVAFTNGKDAELDADFLARFRLYIANLSKATKSAIGGAILAIQSNLSYSLVENESYAGATQYGYFYVVVDDGTGAPSAGLLSSVNNAVDAVRGFTITFGVFAPLVVTANVAMTVTVASGYVATDVKTAVQNALNAYIAGLPLGDDLPYTRLAQIAYDTSPGVINVTGVTLNSGTADLMATAKQKINPGTITVA